MLALYVITHSLIFLAQLALNNADKTDVINVLRLVNHISLNNVKGVKKVVKHVPVKSKLVNPTVVKNPVHIFRGDNLGMDDTTINQLCQKIQKGKFRWADVVTLSPLFLAVKQGNEIITSILIECDANPLLVDQLEQQSPLELALHMNNVGITQILLKYRLTEQLRSDIKCSRAMKFAIDEAKRLSNWDVVCLVEKFIGIASTFSNEFALPCMLDKDSDLVNAPENVKNVPLRVFSGGTQKQLAEPMTAGTKVSRKPHEASSHVSETAANDKLAITVPEKNYANSPPQDAPSHLTVSKTDSITDHAYGGLSMQVKNNINTASKHKNTHLVNQQKTNEHVSLRSTAPSKLDVGVISKHQQMENTITPEGFETRDHSNAGMLRTTTKTSTIDVDRPKTCDTLSCNEDRPIRASKHTTTGISPRKEYIQIAHYLSGEHPLIPLHKAVKVGKIWDVLTVLSKGIDIYELDGYGKVARDYIPNDSKLIKCIIGLHVYVEGQMAERMAIQNKNRESPSHGIDDMSAIGGNESEFLSNLVGENAVGNAQKWIEQYRDKTHLSTLLSKGLETFESVVVKEGIDRKNNAVNAGFNKDSDKLVDLVIDRNAMAVKKLLAQKELYAYVGLKCPNPPLHIAVAYGHLTMVKLLLDSGAFVFQEDLNGKLPEYYVQNSYDESKENIRKLLADAEVTSWISQKNKMKDIFR